MILELAQVESDVLKEDEILRYTRVRVEKLCRFNQEIRRGVT